MHFSRMALTFYSCSLELTEKIDLQQSNELYNHGIQMEHRLSVFSIVDDDSMFPVSAVEVLSPSRTECFKCASLINLSISDIKQ